MADKNMADVADKAVDKLSQVADAIGRLAPGVWESAVRSERVEGIVNVAVIVACCALTVPTSRKFLREISNKEAEFPAGLIWGVLSAFIALMAFILVVGCLGNEVSRAVSPEYHAANALLGAAK